MVSNQNKRLFDDYCVQLGKAQTNKFCYCVGMTFFKLICREAFGRYFEYTT